MKLKELFCALCLYRSNFQNLHWNSVGENFDNAHKEISTDYYEMVSGTVDQIAEMLTRFGVNPPNYVEVLDIIKSAEKDYLMVGSAQLYDRTAIVKLSDTMLKDIVDALVACLDSDEMKQTLNAGIKSTLEAILEDYDLQYRYINKRKLSEVPAVAPVAPEENSEDKSE